MKGCGIMRKKCKREGKQEHFMDQKKLLIFDVYGTLISTGNGSIEATGKILALQDKEIDAKEFYSVWKKFHRIHMDKANEGVFVAEEEIFIQDLKALYEKYGIERDYHKDVKVMLDSLVGRICFDDVKETLDELKKKYRVVLGSTTDTAPLMTNLKANKLEFDAVYTSEFIRKYKPHRAFYQYILEREAYEAENAVFIGDSLVDDVYGPKQIGLKTVLVDRLEKHTENKTEIVPDYVVRDFRELLNLEL